MLYRKQDETIIDLSPLQIKQGYAKDLIKLTQEEINEFLKPKEPTIEEIIDDHKRELKETDYKTLKQIEQNSYTEEEYQTIKDRREFLRSEIRRLEGEQNASS